MPLSTQEIYEQALHLPDKLKEQLAERLVASLSKNVDPAIERDHIELAKRRISEIKTGQVASVDGDSVVAEARRILKS